MRLSAGQVQAVAYSPSGELLTYAGSDGKVTTVATATWETVQSIPASQGVVPPRLLARRGLPEGSGRQGSEAAAEKCAGPARRGLILGTLSLPRGRAHPAALARSTRWRTRLAGSS